MISISNYWVSKNYEEVSTGKDKIIYEDAVNPTLINDGPANGVGTKLKDSLCGDLQQVEATLNKRGNTFNPHK